MAWLATGMPYRGEIPSNIRTALLVLLGSYLTDFLPRNPSDLPSSLSSSPCSLSDADDVSEGQDGGDKGEEGGGEEGETEPDSNGEMANWERGG